VRVAGQMSPRRMLEIPGTEINRHNSQILKQQSLKKDSINFIPLTFSSLRLTLIERKSYV
jgi:hypothetical protein